MKKYIIISLICFLIPVVDSDAKYENNIETYKSNISKTIAQVPNIEVMIQAPPIVRG